MFSADESALELLSPNHLPIKVFTPTPTPIAIRQTTSKTAEITFVLVNERRLTESSEESLAFFFPATVDFSANFFGVDAAGFVAADFLGLES